MGIMYSTPVEKAATYIPKEILERLEQESPFTEPDTDPS